LGAFKKNKRPPQSGKEGTHRKSQNLKSRKGGENSPWNWEKKAPFSDGGSRDARKKTTAKLAKGKSTKGKFMARTSQTMGANRAKRRDAIQGGGRKQGGKRKVD